jgi:hypothetical protein
MTKIPSKPFKNWQYEEINDTFGYARSFEHPLFDYFTTLRLEQSHPQYASIEELRRIALMYIDSWNEDEYKFMFISRYLGLVNLISPHYKVFTQRPMSILYDNNTKKTEGIVEFMLARGLQTPKKPHFFLHEYKPEKRRDNDPLGQLLIAMIAAQQVNTDDNPIYGIYVNGRNWFFVILEGKQYATSDPFAVTTDAIFDLFAILEHLRDKMDDLYKNLI